MPKRWMAEITYRTGRVAKVVTLKELFDLHDVVEWGRTETTSSRSYYTQSFIRPSASRTSR